LLLGLGCAGCFTDTINASPTVSIIPPADIALGVPLVFLASAHDDQSGPLQFAWAAAKVACADGNAAPDAAPDPSFAANATLQTFMLTLSSTGSYCVWVTVRDDFGATATATLGLLIDDRAPTAVITGTGKTGALAPNALVPLYSNLVFDGGASSDPDPGDTLSYAWTLTPPVGSVAAPVSCAVGKPTMICFQVDVPGPYVVGLTVTDSEGMTGTQTFTVMADVDRPPCIVATDPPWMGTLVRAPDDTITFQVTGLADDGDPLPAPDNHVSTDSFVWSWRLGTGTFMRMTDPSDPMFSFPAGTFQTGDQLEVRVEAHDRQPGRSSALMMCDANQPVGCDVGSAGMTCDQWVTWMVEIL
jgi:hypothetical protein